jgi:hypothetical protein
MININQTAAFCLNLCIARHMARVYDLNQAVAIKRTARKVRQATKDVKLHSLAKSYSNELECATVGGKRLTGDELKIQSVFNLEQGMRKEGVLSNQAMKY